MCLTVGPLLAGAVRQPKVAAGYVRTAEEGSIYHGGPGALNNRKGASSLSDVGVALLISKLSWLSFLRRVIVWPGSDCWFHIGAELLGVLQRSTRTVLSSLVCLGFADGRYRVRVVVLAKEIDSTPAVQECY